MSETNKLIIRRFTEELINTASATRAAELIAPHAALYVPGMPEPLRGPAGFLSIIEMMRGFPDVRWTLEDMVAEGDKVAARFTMRGTPPTGKSIIGQSTSFYRLAGGQMLRTTAYRTCWGYSGKSMQY